MTENGKTHGCPYCVYASQDDKELIAHIQGHIKKKDEMTLNQFLGWLNIEKTSHGDKLIVTISVKE